MKKIELINQRNNLSLGKNISLANNFITRFIGLLGKKELNEGEGLLIKPCNSIHMMFMKFSIDVVFLSKDNSVIHLIENIKPWKISKIIKKSKSVIELPVGSIKKYDLQISDIIK